MAAPLQLDCLYLQFDFPTISENDGGSDTTVNVFLHELAKGALHGDGGGWLVVTGEALCCWCQVETDEIKHVGCVIWGRPVAATLHGVGVAQLCNALM